MISLPAYNDTSWYDWATEMHTLTHEYVSVTEYGPVSTATIQAAIDDVAAGVRKGPVYIPPGVHTITMSTSTEVFDNGGAAVPANGPEGYCIILRKNVSLIGAGRKYTELKCTDATKSLIGMIAPENCLVQGMTLTGGYVVGGPGAGMGIMTLGTANRADEKCVDNTWRDLHIRNMSSYGLGLQCGYPRGCHIENVKIENTGADGLDLKARGVVVTEPSGNTVNGLVIRNHGTRVSGSCGIDCRGIWQMTNVVVTDFGQVGGLLVDTDANPATPGVNQGYVGVRFRTKDDRLDYWQAAAGRSSLTNFYIAGQANSAEAFKVGLVSGSDSTNFSNGTVAYCQYGLQLQGNNVGSANNTRIINVHALSNTANGFWVTSGPGGSVFTACYGNGNGAATYKNDGSNTMFIGCDSNDATVWDTSVNANTTEVRIGNGGDADTFTFKNPLPGRAQIEAVGAGDVNGDIDILLTPKGNGRLRFGTYTAAADAPTTGYIFIKDATGVSRKVAIIS